MGTTQEVRHTAGAPLEDGKARNVRWSRHVDAPVWPWSLSGWILAALFVLLFIMAHP